MDGMKRFLFGILLLLSQSSNSQVTWDGGGDGISWNDASNWSTNTVPVLTDNVLLDNSVVIAAYTVNIPAGSVTVSINSLRITPLGLNTITILIPSTNTANPGLAVTGSGDALVLNNNGILQNSTGAAGGAVGLTVAGSFRINNGGKYIHNNERGHAAIVNQLSIAAGTELGIFEFNVPGPSAFTISASGRTYGTLILNAAAAGTKTYAVPTALNPLTINGHFQLNQGTSFTWSAVSNIVVNRNLIQQSTSIITLGTVATSPKLFIKGDIDLRGILTENTTGTPAVELNGSTTIQQLSITGTLSGNNLDFVINNPLGTALLGDLLLPYRLSFIQGNLTIGNNSITAPATIGFTSTRHVITNGTGMLKIPGIGAGPIIFPIGINATSWNPVTIAAGNGVDYSARVETGISPVIAFPTYGINRTWNLMASVVNPGVTVSFQYAAADANAGVLPQPQLMEILQTDGVTTWSIIPGNTNINPAGADPSFVITTSSPLTINNSPVPYALGKKGGWILPVGYFIACRAEYRNSTGRISWKVTNIDDLNNFEVQRKINNSVFQTIARISPVSNQLEYDFTDPTISKGINQYRIRADLRNNGIRYSNIVAIIHDSKDILISIAPNPVHTSATLTLSSARQGGVHFTIYDMSGKLVKKWYSNFHQGITTIPIDVTDLQQGVYQVLASSLDTRTFFRFAKL